jgi:hypothetical protein
MTQRVAADSMGVHVKTRKVLKKSCEEKMAMRSNRDCGNSNSGAIRGIHVIFEHFAELAAKRRNGEFNEVAAGEYAQLQELFRNVSFIADWEHRRHLHPAFFKYSTE